MIKVSSLLKTMNFKRPRLYKELYNQWYNFNILFDIEYNNILEYYTKYGSILQLNWIFKCIYNTIYNTIDNTIDNKHQITTFILYLYRHSKSHIALQYIKTYNLYPIIKLLYELNGICIDSIHDKNLLDILLYNSINRVDYNISSNIINLCSNINISLDIKQMLLSKYNIPLSNTGFRRFIIDDTLYRIINYRIPISTYKSLSY